MVPLAHTGPDPRAVMVVHRDAGVAYLAVENPRRLYNVARRALFTSYLIFVFGFIFIISRNHFTTIAITLRIFNLNFDLWDLWIRLIFARISNLDFMHLIYRWTAVPMLELLQIPLHYVIRGHCTAYHACLDVL